MNRIYDFAGIGIGPFNLGLAAMSAPIKGLNAIFFDEHPRFSWHPGLLLDEATLQVAFYADLETLADAITCVDYYLESLEANKPIGDGILDLAEESVAELGFPVGAAQAA